MTAHQQSVNTLAALFRRNQERATRPIWLLGAGASITSGIPDAAKFVEHIARHAYAIHNLGDERAFSRVQLSDWKPYLEDHSWFIKGNDHLAENFPLAVENLLKPPDFRRRILEKYIQPITTSQGFKSLAQMILRRLCCTVLTTNFDSLLVDSLAEHKTHLREIIEINQTRDDLVRFNSQNRCQVVYLHGRVHYYTDCNLPAEVQQLSPKLAERLWPMLGEAPLIVVGYRGAEPSIMEHLLGQGIEKSFGFKHGIYWCSRGGTVSKEVLSLQSRLSSALTILNIQGFDELMVDLDKALANERILFEEHPHEPTGQSWDSLPAASVPWDKIDDGLLLTTLAKYCERLNLGPIGNDKEKFLLDLQLAVKTPEGIVPSNACVLLFGKAPQETFEHARISFLIGRKKQTIFEGPLAKQWDAAVARLQEEDINPKLRLKNVYGGEETLAYPQDAARELVTNLLVHRDYTIQEFSSIENDPGKSLTFQNPGGLPPSILRDVTIREDETFDPIPFKSECRNPVIADIFYGTFKMEKAGSGLTRVKDSMPKHGGRAEFRSLKDNSCLRVSLLQAEQPAPGILVANRRTEVELYTTNLFPFRQIPKTIYRIPTREKKQTRLDFESDEERESVPQCVATGDWIVSFADLRKVPTFAGRNGILPMLEEIETKDFINDDITRKHFVWLLGRHWNNFLRQFIPEGLYDEYKRKRAYFHLLDGTSSTIRYISRTGRKTARDVVKLRGKETPEFENEGFYYEILQMSGDWVVMIKPTYVFTGTDGQTPLPPWMQTRRATRRFKFDRNMSVDNDLVFWSRFLSKQSDAVNLAGRWDDDLLLELNFAYVEVPVPDRSKDEN